MEPYIDEFEGNGNLEKTLSTMGNNSKKNGIASLKPAREKLGLSLKKVADQIGTEESYLKHFEEGDSPTKISASVLYKLSELYKIPLRQLALEAGIITKKEAKHY